jgi:uncharacterized OsmC-like protein
MAGIDSIEGSGFPLGFLVSAGQSRPTILGTGTGRDVYMVEARKLAGHQKEAVVHEGDGGSIWRLASDEGKHLKGTDLAPFPLGYFNAGLSADLMGRIVALAEARGIALDELGIELRNGYYMTGSFFRGDGQGYGEPAKIDVTVDSGADAGAVAKLMADAVDASPALASMRQALTNTFAIYVNGRRRPVETMTPSASDDAPDPFVTYGTAPSPSDAGRDTADLIRKTGQEEAGEIVPAPAGTKTRIIRVVKGACTLTDAAGATETDTWLEMPGMSHFSLKSDERTSDDTAPSGLALHAAGIAFCFMTQLDRYIEHMKFDIDGVRLVQYAPYATSAAGDGLTGVAEPLDTHLFLNGRESEATYEQLMHIAARTCYLHATLGTTLEPELSVVLNGKAVG